MKRQPNGRRGGVATAATLPPGHEDIHERAGRIGITVERVLRELALVGFADMGNLVEWDKEGMKVRLDHEDSAAIVEIVAAAATGRPYRVKLHDKGTPLTVLSRILDMLAVKRSVANQGEASDDDCEDPRERLIREFDRIAEKVGARPVPSQSKQ